MCTCVRLPLNSCHAYSICFVCDEFLANKKITVIAHPPYSLDLVLCDPFVFPKLKMVLKGGRFNDVTIVCTKLWDAFVGIQAVRFTVCFE
jgi:hypothetical protein